MQYVLENDWGVAADDEVIQQINTEVWCLVNGVDYEPVPGGFTDIDAKDIVKMLTDEALFTPEKRLERAAFLLFTTRELTRENICADGR